jgi:uncharacterized protein YgiM (DUF1202 family)
MADDSWRPPDAAPPSEPFEEGVLRSGHAAETTWHDNSSRRMWCLIGLGFAFVLFAAVIGKRTSKTIAPTGIRPVPAATDQRVIDPPGAGTKQPEPGPSRRSPEGGGVAAMPVPEDAAYSYVIRGVVAPDTLNVREEPSLDSAVVATIPANAGGVVAIGPRRRVGVSVWWEVTYAGQRGWVNSRFLALEGAGAPEPR